MAASIHPRGTRDLHRWAYISARAILPLYSSPSFSSFSPILATRARILAFFYDFPLSRPVIFSFALLHISYLIFHSNIDIAIFLILVFNFTLEFTSRVCRYSYFDTEIRVLNASISLRFQTIFLNIVSRKLGRYDFSTRASEDLLMALQTRWSGALESTLSDIDLKRKQPNQCSLR